MADLHQDINRVSSSRLSCGHIGVPTKDVAIQGMHSTHLLNEDLCIQNEQAKRGFNLCMYDNAEKLIFEILPHSILYYSQYR